MTCATQTIEPGNTSIIISKVMNNKWLNATTTGLSRKEVVEATEDAIRLEIVAGIII